jgi:hypothetical protein
MLPAERPTAPTCFGVTCRVMVGRDYRKALAVARTVDYNTFRMLIRCRRCCEELVSPGALVFGTPDHDEAVCKHYLCAICYGQLLTWLYDAAEILPREILPRLPPEPPEPEEC